MADTLSEIDLLKIDRKKHEGLTVLWKDRAERAEARVARVEALLSDDDSWFISQKEIREALAGQQPAGQTDQQPETD